MSVDAIWYQQKDKSRRTYTLDDLSNLVARRGSLWSLEHYLGSPVLNFVNGNTHSLENANEVLKLLDENLNMLKPERSGSDRTKAEARAAREKLERQQRPAFDSFNPRSDAHTAQGRSQRAATREANCKAREVSAAGTSGRSERPAVNSETSAPTLAQAPAEPAGHQLMPDAPLAEPPAEVRSNPHDSSAPSFFEASVEEVSCPVCLEPLGDKGGLIAELQCGHRYCLECVADSLRQRECCTRGARRRTPACSALQSA